jgi:hypothetical protein
MNNNIGWTCSREINKQFIWQTRRNYMSEEIQIEVG